MRIFITLLLSLHFFVLTMSILSKHNDWTKINHLTSKYTYPYCVQEWEMFAPPPTQNTRLYFRYIIQKDGVSDTTAFRNVLKPLYHHQISDEPSISRLTYYLFNCIQNTYSNYIHIVKNVPDSIQCNEEKLKEYMDREISKSYSHQSFMIYGKKAFQKKYDPDQYDNIFMSYHFLEVDIPRYKDRFDKTTTDMENINMNAWNSSFYKIF